MSEWKIGDKVRLVGSSWGHTGTGDDGLSVGAIAIVDEIDEDGAAMVKGWYVSNGKGEALSGDWATERMSDTEAPTVKRRDISLSEGRETSLFTTTPLRTWWEAELSGSLSTGESVCMERVGATASNALAALEQAISDEGWVIEGGDD